MRALVSNVLTVAAAALCGCTPKDGGEAGRAVAERFVEALHREDVGGLEQLVAAQVHLDVVAAGLHGSENPARPRAELLSRFQTAFDRCSFDAVPVDEIVDPERIEAMTMSDSRNTFGGSIRGAADSDVLVLLPVRADPQRSPYNGSPPAAAAIDDCVDSTFVLLVRREGGSWRVVGYEML